MTTAASQEKARETLSDLESHIGERFFAEVVGDVAALLDAERAEAKQEGIDEECARRRVDPDEEVAKFLESGGDHAGAACIRALAAKPRKEKA
jgi:hypothetical protein